MASPLILGRPSRRRWPLVSMGVASALFPSMSCPARLIAAIIETYPVQRQRVLLNPCVLSSSDLCPLFSMGVAPALFPPMSCPARLIAAIIETYPVQRQRLLLNQCLISS